MNARISFISLVLMATSCNTATERGINDERASNQPVEQEQAYPWTVDVTEAAIQAVHRSIKNVERPATERDKNFPANLYNMPFQLTEIEELHIVGYETSTDNPHIYQIDFRPADEMISGPRVTVEINVVTHEVLRVYMSPDS